METEVIILALELFKSADWESFLIGNRISVRCKYNTDSCIVLKLQINRVKFSIDTCFHDINADVTLPPDREQGSEATEQQLHILLYQTDVPEAELNAALSDLRAQRRREKAQYQGAPFADVFQVELILSEEDSDRACIVDVGDTGMSYVIPWSSIPQELQQPLRCYVAQADGKLCGYCKENLCNTENGRMIVELYLGKQEHHVSRILY